MDYREQIKSPKWQKRRLEILQKDNFTCQICGDTESTLHVHHLHYNKGKMIWEYEDWELITLCENCHNCEHTEEMSFLYERIEYLKRRGVTIFEINALLESVDVLLFTGHDDIIHSIVGDESGRSENDIKNLTERRKRLKIKRKTTTEEPF